MKIIVAPDRFKGTLSAVAVAQAMGRGAVFALPPDIPLTLVELPLANGGEGLVDCLTAATYGRKIVTTVTAAMGNPLEAEWGLLGDGSTAVIEATSTSGLQLIPLNHYKPMRATSFGIGQLIAAALDRGVTRIIVGTGANAALDGGAGMAQALGIHLRDAQGYEIGRGARLLPHMARIDIEKRHQRLARTEIIVAADTDYQLCGPGGAAAICAAQLALTPEDASLAESALEHLAERLRADLDVNIAQLAGSGAGGGLAAGLVGFLGAKLSRGIDLVLETVRFDEHLRQAALVLTGEGQIEQPLRGGSVTTGVSSAARDAAVPCLAIVGKPGATLDQLRPAGINAVHALAEGDVTSADAKTNTADLLEEVTRKVVRQFIAENIMP